KQKGSRKVAALPNKSITADSQLQTGPERKRKARIADRPSVLLAEKVIQLRENSNMPSRCVEQVGVQLGVPKVEIVIWEEEAVAAAGIESIKICGIVCPACDSPFQACGKSGRSILRTEKSGVRRTAEGSSA